MTPRRFACRGFTEEALCALRFFLHRFIVYAVDPTYTRADPIAGWHQPHTEGRVPLFQ